MCVCLQGVWERHGPSTKTIGWQDEKGWGWGQLNRKKGTFEGGVQIPMRVKVAGRCWWTAFTEIIRFVLHLEKTKGFCTEFVCSHCEHTKALISDLFQTYRAGEWPLQPWADLLLVSYSFMINKQSGNLSLHTLAVKSVYEASNHGWVICYANLTFAHNRIHLLTRQLMTQVMCESARSTLIVLHLKCVFHEHISSVSAAEPQRTQCDKELSGNLITKNSGVDIAVFGIHVRVQRQKTSCSNLAAAVSVSRHAKSQSLSRNRAWKKKKNLFRRWRFIKGWTYLSCCLADTFALQTLKCCNSMSIYSWVSGKAKRVGSSNVTDGCRPHKRCIGPGNAPVKLLSPIIHLCPLLVSVVAQTWSTEH